MYVCDSPGIYVRFPRTEQTAVSCHVCAGTQGPPEEQLMLLMAEPSHQPLVLVFLRLGLYVAMAVLELRDCPDSVSQVLGSKAVLPLPGFFF